MRDRYAVDLRRMADIERKLGADPWAARELAKLAAGEPVIVQHGWEIDLEPPHSGPFCLEPDGTIRLI